MQASIPTRCEPYRPLGAARTLLLCREPEVLLSGPAGTGKSRACLEKLHLCALKYPGMRGLIARKTRASLSQAGLVTLEEKVFPPGSRLTEGPARAGRRSYLYPNGSEIVLAGLDRPSRIMSAEYDLCYVQEAIELAEEDWESLSTRLRNGRMPYQQLLADTNPAGPNHWLKRRCDAGRTRLLESRHEDNPAMTPAYLEALERLTGARYHRLRHGRWVQSEGVVYDEWDAALHLTDHLPRGDVRCVWSFDFGFTHPLVWQAWLLDGDGRMTLARELYATQMLVEDAAAEIRRLTRADEGGDARLGRPEVVLCDHDAEDRRTLERHLDCRTIRAYKRISPGIQAVKSRLRPAADGRPRLFLWTGAPVRRDAGRVEAGKPASTREEMDLYVWAAERGEPVKEHDHGLDALRYAVAEVDGVGRKTLRAL